MRRYGRATRYRGAGGAAPVVTPSTLATVVSSPVDDMAIADPVAIANMRSFLGLPASSTYGGTGTVAFTSVRNVTGPDGNAGKAVSQHLEVGTWGMPDGIGNGTGIAMTSVPLGASYERARIAYDIRVVGSGTWPLGFKIPGLGGLKPGGTGGVPTGGDPSPDGWSGRNMIRRNNAAPTVSGSLRGYMYTPLQAVGSYGQDRLTGQLIPWSTWHRVEMEYVMNDVTTEGSTSPPANGVHRMWLDGTLCWEKLDEILRLHSTYGANYLTWDLFSGGNDSTFAMPSNVEVQVKNLLIQGGASDVALPVADTTAPTTPTNVLISNVTSSGFTVSWTGSADDTAVTGYSVKVDGVTYASPTTTSVDVTGRAPSTTYSVRVQARDGAGNFSGLSAAVNATTTAAPVAADTTAPTAPGTPTITDQAADRFTVTWTASSDAVGVTGYSVNVDGSTWGTTTGATSLVVTGRAASTSYAVKVIARDAAGNFSTFSPTVNATTTADGTAPAAPVTSTLYTTQTPTTPNASDGEAVTLGTRFSADVNGQVTGMRFYRATTAPASAVVGTLYNDAGQVLATATFGTLTTGWNSITFSSPVSVTAGTIYRIAYWSSGPYVASGGLTPFSNGRLTALDSRYSYSATPTMPATLSAAGYFADVTFFTTAAATAPATPAAPSAYGNDSSLLVSWAAPSSGGSPITGYDVQSFAGTTPGPVVSVGNVTSATLTGLTNGTSYTVKVRAKNAIGTSSYSAASSPTTPAPAPTTYPDASNTGVPTGTTLTAYTGPLRITQPNTIIEDKIITDRIDIIAGATGVIIRRCRINVGQNANWCILSDEGETVTVLDCELIGGTDATIAGNHITRRCNVSGSVDGIKISAGEITDCYLHDFLINSVTDTHNDGIQCLGTTSLKIQHNRITMGVGATSCVLLSTGSASDMRNVLIDNNLCTGGAYSIYGGYQAGADVLSKVSNIVVSNNKISTAVNPNGGAYGPLSSCDPPVVNTNNTWYDGPKVGQVVA